MAVTLNVGQTYRAEIKTAGASLPAGIIATAAANNANATAAVEQPGNILKVVANNAGGVVVTYNAPGYAQGQETFSINPPEQLVLGVGAIS